MGFGEAFGFDKPKEIFTLDADCFFKRKLKLVIFQSDASFFSTFSTCPNRAPKGHVLAIGFSS